MIPTLVVFGAAGDLAGRLVLPAVASLLASGELGTGFRLVGAGADDLSATQFSQHVRRKLADHAQHVGPDARGALVQAVQYRRADVGVAAEVAAVLELARAGSDDAALAVYLALPTQLMRPAVQNLTACGLPPGSRVAVEKPFGYDADSARALNAALATLCASSGGTDVYRVDHFLALPALERLPVTPVPGTDRPVAGHSRNVVQVDVLFEETLALEGRASFYDRAGALRDVMQNHQVQMLCTLAAEPAQGAAPGGPGAPGAPGAESAAERRAAVLRTVRPLTAADVAASTRRARYTAGHLARTAGADGREVPDYAAEPGVDAARDTETFAEVVLQLDSPRWDGVRFVLRAGKALAARRRGVLIHFRPGPDVPADPVWMDLDEPSETGLAAEPLAYRRIVADLLAGGTAFAVSGEEAELAWKVFMPVLDGWAGGLVPLTTYPAGTAGPAGSDDPAG